MEDYLRFETRLIHVPSGKTTMLYSSRHSYSGDPIKGVNVQEQTKSVIELKAPIEFWKMRLPPGNNGGRRGHDGRVASEDTHWL